MDNPSQKQMAEIGQAFRTYECTVQIQNYQLACILALISMLLALPMDYIIYPEQTFFFFKLRILNSLLLLAVWLILRAPIGASYYRMLGHLVASIPAFFISLMIFLTEGPRSPYYAGLNLVLLGAVLLLRWSFIDSAVGFLITLSLYLLACMLHPTVAFKTRIFLSNIWFMSITGIFAVAGSYAYNRIRFREFALRYELDQKKKMIEESNAKLIQLDQAKSRFFANISHELRTPLTLLLAPLETLLNRYQSAFDEKTRELLQVMHANSMRLLRLINDLLDLVRLESSSMHIKKEPLDIAEFTKGLASAVRQVADDKRIQLVATVDPQLGMVMADRDKLEKVVLNLVFNALKFTPAGGRIELRAEKRDSDMVLHVADTGMGISSGNLQHLFSRFWQADDSSRRKFQGVGIGLALVKELTEVHGGQVSVQSEEGKGTTFTIRIPYEAAPPAASEAKLEKELVAKSVQESSGVTSEEWLANLYRRAEFFPAMTAVKDAMRPIETEVRGHLSKVLIADDEPDMLRFLKSQLIGKFEVIEAVDGAQAVEKACQFLPDVILVDMMMPEKDGLQVCKELRERPATQSIPIILLTARADEETKLAALNAGASDFLPKPFSTTELHVRLKNLVHSYESQRKLAKQKHALENTIDQLKETESQLVQTEKLASLGRLSAGIIHEINNPLNFATTGLFTLRNKAKNLPPEQQQLYSEILQDIEDGLGRVKTIITDLRSFSHHENEHAQAVNISATLNSALRFLSHEYKNKVQIQQNLDPEQIVWANKNKLIQVFVNLLQNSIDALKNKKFENGQATIWLEGRVENGVNIVRFRDNGEGIPAEVMDKIFDPFFTTKDVGQGMGLGLSICYRIIQSFEGTIRVKSEPGQFCEFTLEFPVKQMEAVAA
jgi:signal transduction histidine kinase